MNVPVKLAGVDVKPNDILFGECVLPFFALNQQTR